MQDTRKALRADLRAELKRRKKLNPRYSNRAFAAHLRISDSSLSKILRGLRLPSDKTLYRIGRVLKWNENQLQASKRNLQRLRKRTKRQARSLSKNSTENKSIKLTGENHNLGSLTSRTLLSPVY